MGSLGPAAYSHHTTTEQAVTGPGRLVSAVLTSDGSARTLTIYDNTAASGSIVLLLAAPANDSKVFTLESGLAYGKGLHVVLSGGTCDLGFVAG